MEVDINEVVEVHKDIHKLSTSLEDYIEELIKTVRQYNYAFTANYAGKIKLNGFKSRLKLNINSVAVFDLSYKGKSLIHTLYKPYLKNEKLVINIYENEYRIDIENIILIKEFAAEIKKKIEIINISMQDVI